MSMTPKERVISAMKKEELDRPPVAIFTQSATLGQMDFCGAAWPEAHGSVDLMATLAAAQADQFGFECARAAFCLTAEAERLGCEVAVVKRDAAPMIKKHPFNFDCIGGAYDDPAALMAPEEFIEGGRPKVVIDAVAKLAKERPELAIVAGNTGPFTLAGHMINTENMVLGMMLAPEEVAKWTAGVTPIIKAYCQALSDAGADVIQMSEPSASGDMLDPSMFPEASGIYVAECLAKTKDCFSVLHICGDASGIMPGMIDTGVTGISIEEKVDPFKAAEIAAGRTVLVGNVGSVRPLFQGTPEEVKAGALASCEAGFGVISSGCGIATETPNENMQMLVDTVKAFKR